nr:E3 ubiquitin-protein ligase ubr3 isoform X1 [Parasteatoda tepidariorum]
MASAAADVLIKKGKRVTAAYIQGVCTSQSNTDIMNEVFDTILNPLVPISEWETIDWCRWLMGGGRSPEEFAQTVRKYDSATTCGYVWTANFVAYRCRTCGISPCMSLCSDCFQKGDHRNHDFNMFRSLAGGACDCGDKSVMKESGFCQRHGLQNQINKPEIPPDLLCVAEVFMPRLFLRLVRDLRENSEPASSDRYLSSIHYADGFLSLLQSFSEMGAAMKSIMTSALINPKGYYSLAVDCVSGTSRLYDYKMENLTAYLDARRSLEDSSEDLVTGEDGRGRSSWCDVDSLKESCFLDELVFWTIKFEFPQKLVCLLLNLMPDLTYKQAFTKIFVNHYGRINKMLAESKDSDTLSNRVVHVSVQLFSNEDLAYQMTKEYRLLHVMVDSLYRMMHSIAQKSTLQCAEKNHHFVVDCSHHIMKEHCYWPLISDLNNVLTHSAVAYEFISDTTLLSWWFKFLSLLQGMNVNNRELKSHVEFESNTYYAAFSAELESSATPMWALISHLKNPDALDRTKTVLEICTRALHDWFQAIGFSVGDEINPYQVSFHIPLHRCFASFLGEAVREQGGSLDELLPDEKFLKLLMMHPLQAQVAFHEILCNMWVRSGLQIKGQAMTYIQCHFCVSIVDADLFILQLCAMKLDPDDFLKTVMQRFHVWEWLTFHPSRTNSFLESDKVLPMLEGALSFLATLLSIQTNIGQTEEEIIRQEMVSLLCMSDRTHSQLMDFLPDRSGETTQNKNFETILGKVADYKAPNFETGGAMLQGTFVPKPHIWEVEYNPIHVLLRSVHRREYQSSLDRYTQYLKSVRQSNKIPNTARPWAPFRIPNPVFKQFHDPRRILHCKTMHGIIFTILHRAVNDPDIPEQVLQFCIYLLDMAVRFPSTESQDSTTSEDRKEVNDLKYEEWFDSSRTLDNVSKVIERIVITEKVEMSMRMVEEMEVDEEMEEDMDLSLNGIYTVYDVHSPIIEEDPTDQPTLPSSVPQLALPAAAAAASALNTVTSNEAQMLPFDPELAAVLQPIVSLATLSSSPGSSATQEPIVSTPQPLALPASSNSFNMALIPTSEGLTTVRPKCMKLKQVPGRTRMLLSDKGLPLAIGSSDCDSSSKEQRYLPFCNKRTISVNESIVSLLLQLHSKLSERPDSYKVKESLSEVISSTIDDIDSRIGDGAKFVERLLDHIVASGIDKLCAVQLIRQKLWPQKIDDSSSSTSDSSVDKEERRRRAKERQQKLMAEFASKQKAFMQKTMETEAKASTSAQADSIPDVRKEFECVICGQMSASEENRPVGMVVLLQATSVVGHSHEVPDRKLPCDDNEISELQRGENLSSSIKNRLDILMRYFDNRFWPMALNIGWEGGVHVQSCGHYLHIDCHKSYMVSLKSQNQLSSRLQNLAVDQGEYYCPLCRQLANSVIPLRPNFDKRVAIIQCPGSTWSELVSEVSEFLASPLSDEDLTLLKKYMGGIMEDVTNATLPVYRSPASPNSSSLFLFVCSIVRTNLEVELIQKRKMEMGKKKSCFVPLFNVLSLHSSLLAQTIDKSQGMDYAMKVWYGLTGQMASDHYSLTCFQTEVPLLLRDPIALLLQIVLSLPMNFDKAYFKCIVQVLYNFMFIQALVRISCKLNSTQRYEMKSIALKKLKESEGQLLSPTEPESSISTEEISTQMDLQVLLGNIITHLESSCLYLDDDELKAMESPLETSIDCLENYIQEFSLHFLKVASLLQCHLFDDEIKLKIGSAQLLCQMEEKESEFQLYSKFLCLNAASSEINTACSCIQWTLKDHESLVKTWCEDYMNFINKSVIAARSLQLKKITWHPPSLLKLPHNYDDIFKFYYKRPCSACRSDPKDPSLCLVCGTMVCLRENCCRQQSQYEAVTHSVACGGGTAIYLAVNSSTIIVIRGKRACLWGSVYLDNYGEEDRDLKRGKPLYLSTERYTLLQQQWINHSFDHTNKRWVWHKDNL